MKYSSEQKNKYDSRHFPKRPHVGVGGIIFWNYSVLLIKRKFNPAKGKWSIPGGHLEVGETLAEGALRESMEETGLLLKVNKMAEIIERIDKTEDGKVEYHYVLVDYYLDIVGDFSSQNVPKPVAQDDAEEAKFVDFGDLYNYDLTYTVKDLFQKIGIMQ